MGMNGGADKGSEDDKGMRFARRIKDNKAGISLGNQAMLLPWVKGNIYRNCGMNPRNSESDDVLEKCVLRFFVIFFCFFNVVPDLVILP